MPIVKFDNANVNDQKAAMPENVSLSTLQYFVDDSSYTVLKATDGTLTAYPTWYLVVPSGNGCWLNTGARRTEIILSLYVYDGEEIYCISKNVQSKNAGTVTYNNK